MASNGTHRRSTALHLEILLSVMQLQCLSQGGAVSDVGCLCCGAVLVVSIFSPHASSFLIYCFAWHGYSRSVVLLWLEAGFFSSVGQCQVTLRSIASSTVDLNTVPSPPLLCFNAQRHQILFVKGLNVLFMLFTLCYTASKRNVLPVQLGIFEKYKT